MLFGVFFDLLILTRRIVLTNNRPDQQNPHFAQNVPKRTPCSHTKNSAERFGKLAYAFSKDGPLDSRDSKSTLAKDHYKPEDLFGASLAVEVSALACAGVAEHEGCFLGSSWRQIG